MEYILENEYLKVEFDENGLLDKVIDKETGRQILTDKGNLLTISMVYGLRFMESFSTPSTTQRMGILWISLISFAAS